MDRDLEPETKPCIEVRELSSSLSCQEFKSGLEGCQGHSHAHVEVLIDVLQLLVVKEEEPPEPPHIKEEDDEEKAQSSQLHQTQTEHMEPAADGEDCGGPEPARNSHLDPHLQPETEDQPEDSSETEDSVDYSKETREPQSGLKALKNKVSEREKRRKTGEKPYICSDCGKRFSYHQSLKRHILIHTGETLFSCSVCIKTFTVKANLKYHMLSHTGEKPFSCSICDKKYTQKGNLIGHMFVHTGEKRFSCSDCGKRFGSKSHLKRHMITHTGEKPFSCKVCSKTFTQRADLTHHTLVHTGERPFSCSDCGKRFSRNQTLKIHMRIHTGQQLKCSVCDKKYNNKGCLTRHMVVHTGEKPFSCSVCHKSFTKKSSLTKHMVLHTGEKQFSCKVCEQRFMWYSSLRRHKAVCLQSSQLHQNQTEENREAEPGASSSTEQLNLQMKEEPEELWSSQEGEQLQHITKFPFTPVPVKSEDDEEKPQSSQLHQTQTEHMEPAADGEDCGGPEPARNSHLDPHLQPETEDQPEDSSETEDRDDYSKETREPQSGLKALTNKVSIIDKRCNTGEKPYICSDCGKRFSRNGRLERHMRIHTGEKPFSCSVCHNTFTRKETLKDHMVLHTGEKRFSCKVCEQRFTWNSALRRHKAVCLQSSQLHQNQTEENREAEPGASSSTEQLNLQMKEEPEELWSSQEGEQLQHITKFPFTPVPVKSEDDEEKAQSSQLHQTQTEHMEPAADGEDCGGPEPARNSHPDPHLQPETEDQPEDSSETEDREDYSKETSEPQAGLKALKNKVSERDKRRKTGQKRFICSFCGKRFSRNGRLERHMRIHTGEKPFSCSVCSKTFTRKGSLTNHMILHTGEKPFRCSVCSKTFTQRADLTHHTLVHTGEKPFSCSDCGKRFSRNQTLNIHMRIHTGQQLKCSVCDKKYNNKGCLTRHMVVHTGEKPFSCSVCRKSFTKKSSLTTHMVVHTGEKRFSCKVCEQRFMWNKSLRRHKAVCTKSSQLHQNQTEENREAEPGASSSTEQLNLQIKEEPEELWSSQEGEQLQHITKFSFTPVPVKSEDDEEKAQSSQLHQTQTEHMEPAADGEDCGGPEPARNSHPDPHLQPETEDQTEDRDDDWTQTSKVLPSDVLKVIVGEEEQLKCNPILKLEPPHSLDQEDPPEPPHIKEEQEELWGSEEAEQLLDIPKEPARNSHPDPHLEHETEDQPEDSSETEDSDDYSKETREPQSGLKALKNKVSESDKRRKTGQKRFICSFCGKRFSRNGRLEIHMRIHTGEKPFSCSVCSKTFTQKGSLTNHMILHTGEKPFRCSVCLKTFTQKSTLKDHMVIHTGEKRFSCKDCEQRFMWNSALRRHKAVCLQSSQLHQNQTEENREAEPGASSSTEQLNLQIKEEPEELWSSQEGEQLQHITKFPFTPVPVKSEDDEEKPQSSQLHQTQTEHTEPAADGEDCGGPEPARNSHPDPHLQPKTEDQPEDSSETEDRHDDYSKETREPQSGLKALKNKVSEREKRRKTGEKPYICSDCGKRFSYHQSLKRHIRIHTGETPFSCSVCSETFTQRADLTHHTLVHTGEKPFSCSDCGKRFSRNQTLNIHMRIHTGQQLNCSVCDRKFNSNGNLTRHMVVHTGEKLFSCKVCEQRFMWNASLKRHEAVCTKSSQLHQNQTEENREAEPGASSSTEQLNLQMKEEPEELWSSQEGEQLQHITKFPFTPVPVKSEDDEEKAQSSHLHQTQT